MPSRRHVLTGAVGTVATLFSGCLFRLTGRSTPSPASCSATPPPEPTGATTQPEPYPAGPPTLRPQPVEQFLRQYERAYQYNDALAAYPEKIGRTNEIEVQVDTVSLDRSGDRFTGTVSGEYISNFIDRTPRATTPTTPTETPLPAGHGPFETAYTLTEHRLQRNGQTLECW